MRTAYASALWIALGASVLSAQQTWGGLRFGMSEAETMAVLKGRLPSLLSSFACQGFIFRATTMPARASQSTGCRSIRCRSRVARVLGPPSGERAQA